MQEQMFGDYRVIKQLGSGALGDLYLVEHRFLKKQFALKVLPSELAEDRGFVQRFEEEVMQLAQLEHPHLVKTHTVSHAGGVYFFVTDCVVDALGETTNLAQYMSGKKGRLREEELMSVTKQVADALDYVHKKGIVHRGIKLNNILIGRSHNSLHVYISDVGLSKIISAGKVILQTFKSMSEALGTLPADGGTECRYVASPVDAERQSKLSHSFLQSYAFLAPEQKRFEQVGVQADTYAFGVLVYYLIAGTFPEGHFKMPSEIASEYHHDWDSIITGCLNYDPLRRPTQLLPLLEKQLSYSAPMPDMSFTQKAEAVFEPAPLRSITPPLREEGTLRPIIQRPLEELAPQRLPSPVESVACVGAGPALSFVDVHEMPSSSLPAQDESYAKQLNAMLNRDPVITQYSPEKKEHKKIDPIQTEMVVIRGGYFMRGSNSGNRDEMPCHKIELESFAIDIHPVTNEQFIRFLEYVGGEKDQNYNDLIRLKDSRVSRTSGRLSIEPGYAKHPVVGVTWYGATAYAKWAGKRLPYESEWEIAARGGLENFMYPKGDLIEKSQANFFSSDTTSVMSYAPNSYGLYDMAGNVYEWCYDWYGYNYYETSALEPYYPKGPPQGVYRVLRGGCWKSLQEDMRCSHRHRNNPGTVNSTYGFRCAADVR